MTVRELKEKLNDFDETVEVVVKYRDCDGFCEGTDEVLYLMLSHKDGLTKLLL